MVRVCLSHERAITPIADPIHDRIELNVFEREFVDSQYFQRLHFVLQNSVSYTTFPANKNTRFPHSLGVAEICGNLFSGGLRRARYVTLDGFLREAATFIENLYLELHPRPGGINRFRGDHFSGLVDAHLQTISGLSGFTHSPIFPSKLQSDSNGGANRENDPEEEEANSRVHTEHQYGIHAKFPAIFVVDTLWQAVRLYALMHDVGHLPMSHAFEDAMNYQLGLMAAYGTPEVVQSQFDELFNERKKEFTSALSDEIDNRDYSGDDVKSSPRYVYLKLFADVLGTSVDELESVAFDKDFHEIRGLSLFNRYLRDYRFTFSYENKNFKNDPIQRYSELIQYLTLCIFFSSALTPSQLAKGENSFLLAIKSLVDGDFDGDRMDYTLRDGHEAGSDIGKFDLTRIVSNAMLISRSIKTNPEKRCYTFGYYIRALSGIEQFYEQRYQSYKYIIYHRTASRANSCLERLISQIVHYSFLSPNSIIADLTESFGYIERKNGNIVSILPDTEENIFKIDDSNLRTLFIQILNSIENDKSEADRNSDRSAAKKLELIKSDIANLIRIIAFREYAHVRDPLKKTSAQEYLKREEFSRFNLTPDQSKLLVRKLIRERSEHISELQTRLNEKSIEGEIPPTSIFAVKFSPKIFKYHQNAKKPFEKQLAVVRESGRAIHAGEMSSSLRSMIERKGPESFAKFYLVSRNIKFDKKSYISIIRIINEYLVQFIEKEIRQGGHQNV